MNIGASPVIQFGRKLAVQKKKQQESHQKIPANYLEIKDQVLKQTATPPKGGPFAL